MVDIRPTKREDWGELRVIDAEIFPDDPLLEEFFLKRIERDGCFTLLLNRKIVGNLIVARYGKDGGHLGRIGVAKAHHNKGLGSVLLEYAIDWFQQQGGIRVVHLFTQDFNNPAQILYKKYGFERSGTTWHYFVPFATLQPANKYSCQKIRENEIDSVGDRFPSMPSEQIRRFLTYEEYLVLTLKDQNGNIQGACRFTPTFPGCMPFEITHLDCFDDFLMGIKELSLPEYDYCRVTFTDIPQLAKLCEDRGYHLHHRLHKMSLSLE